MSPATKKEEPEDPDVSITPYRDGDGFLVEEDGLVDVRLELTFVEDVKVRVTPDVAKRIMDGEFDNQDPGDIPGIEFSDILDTTRIELESAYEGRPVPPDRTVGVVDGNGSDGDDDDDIP